MDHATQLEPGVTVFLVDPCEVFHLGLEALLAPVPDLQFVGAARTAAEARRAVAEGWADVVLIDADLDGHDGQLLSRQLADQPSAARYCFLVRGTDPASAAALCRHGASGLLHRHAAGRQLVDTLRRLTHDDLVLDPLTSELFMAGHLHPPLDRSPAGLLTDRDLELLRLLGEGRTNREIADAVYLSEKTVKNYLSRLFRKLGVRSRTEAALLSARYGAAAATDVIDRFDVAESCDVAAR